MTGRWHGRAWTVLLAAGCALEAHALRYANPRGTLSAHLRRVTGCTRSELRRAGLLAGMGWLAAHLLSDTPVDRPLVAR